MSGPLEFDFNFGRPGRRRDDSEPMRMLVLGDFSGTPAPERTPLATRSTLRVDLDTLDKTIQRLGPKLRVPAAEISVRHIDDFHPDQLFKRLELFQRLQHSRAHPPVANLTGDDDLGRLLGKPAPTSTASTTASTPDLDSLIRHIIAPHVVKEPSAETMGHLAAVDAAMTEQMRTMLHDPAFQSLESAWRGIQWLISNLELDDQLSLHLIDVTREELLGDVIAAEGRLAQTGLYRALVERSRNESGGGWSLLVGLFDFGPSNVDMGLLAALGLIASQAGGPLLAGADLALAGGDEQALAGWRALRRSEAAAWIGLAAPRVLLRMPYGASSDPIESFAFEEFVSEPVPQQLLWGTASLATALLIGQAFNARGWEMEPGDERTIEGLPACTFVRDGEPVMQPCAERLLTERELDAMVQAGLIPVAGRRDRNTVTAIRFQSVADPPAPLNL